MRAEPRRLDARVRVNQRFDEFEAHLDAWVSDLSRKGAFVRTRAPLAPGERVALYFTVLEPEMACVEGVGEVVRVQSDPPGVGVIFVELTPSSQAVLERVLAAT